MSPACLIHAKRHVINSAARALYTIITWIIYTLKKIITDSKGLFIAWKDYLQL